MLAAWGRFVYRRRWAVLVLCGLSLVAAVFLLGEGATPGTGQPSSGTEAQKAAAVMQRNLPSDPESFYLILGSTTMKADTPTFEAAVKRAIQPLRQDPRVAGVTTAYDGGAVSSEAAAGPENGPDPPEEQLISRDGRHTLVVVEFEKRPESELVDEVYPRLREKVDPGPLEVVATGGVPFDADSGRILEDDLRRAELVSLPTALLVLLFVFGSVVAAGIPLGVGVLAVAVGLAAVGLLARFTGYRPTRPTWSE